jgi:hypothetical protein
MREAFSRVAAPSGGRIWEISVDAASSLSCPRHRQYNNKFGKCWHLKTCMYRPNGLCCAWRLISFESTDFKVWISQTPGFAPLARQIAGLEMNET